MDSDAQCRDEEVRRGLIGEAEEILAARDGVSIAEAERCLRASARVTHMRLSDVAKDLLSAHRHRSGST